MSEPPPWHPSDDDLRHRLGTDLEPDEDEVTRHVEGCTSCQGRLTQMTALSPSRQARVRRARIQPPPPPLPDYPYEKDPRGFPILLGQGSFGMVFLARCRDDERRLVAVKFLQLGEDMGARERQWFVGEVLAALELDHPALVRGLDFNAAGGRPYYVMEFVGSEARPGRNLRDFQGDEPLLPGKPGRVEEVADWLRHLAGGLAHAHARYLIHRDLNPCNILVKPRAGGGIETMKVCDFGLARRDRLADLEEASGEELGVLPFVAPELLSEEGRAGPAADLYALGAVGYYMLTGRPPFPPGAADLRELIRTSPPAPLRRLAADVPVELETILLTCLRKEPRHRYESAEDLAADLDRFRRGQRPRARRWLGHDLARRWLHKNRLPMAVVAVISVLLVAALCLLGWVRVEHEQARQNAEVAREETWQRLAESARAARARGALAVAEQHLDRAIEIAPAEKQRELEVDRLRALFAHGRWDRLGRELERLGGRDDLTAPQRALVLLHQGDRDLWTMGEVAQARGRRRIEEALRIEGGLGDADRSYARGVLAGGAVEAIRWFEDALRPDRDPFHLRANACLLMELVLSGQFERARERARFMAVAFPAEPVVPLALATMAALEDDPQSRQRYRDEVERRVGRARMAGIDAGFRTIERAIVVDRAMYGERGALGAFFRLLATDLLGLGGGDLASLFRPPAASLFRTEGIGEVVGVGLPLLQRPFRMLGELVRIHTLLLAGRLDAAEALLGRATEESPESLFRTQLCYLYCMRWKEAAARRDAEAELRLSVLCYRAAAEAATAPTLIPFGTHRRAAAWMGVLFESAWRATPRHLASLSAGMTVGTAHPLQALAPLAIGREQMQQFRRIVPQRSDGRLLRLVAEPSRPDPARPVFLPVVVFQLEPEQAGHLLLCWQRDEPGDVRPYRLLARLALRRGDAAGALRWTRRGQALHPWDLELAKVGREARARAGR